jgi:hypothetical protein
MKKIFGFLLIAGLMTACNNDAENGDAADSIDARKDTLLENVDSAMQAKKDSIDQRAKELKESIDSTQEKRKDSVESKTQQ